MSKFKKASRAVQNREIRAIYDDFTITVYQAYNSEIANAAVQSQKLDASPSFKPRRMTWIKPSWNWMMYRAGYSYKDENQSNILALRVRREFFENMLLTSVESGDEKKRNGNQVRVQWDPERNVRIGVLSSDYRIRSIQIGIPAEVKDTWVSEGIVEIIDVTKVARELRRVLDGDPDITVQKLKEMGLIPEERTYPVSEELAKVLGMAEV